MCREGGVQLFCWQKSGERCVLFNELGAKISLLYALEILKYLAKGKRTPDRPARMKGGVSGTRRDGAGRGEVACDVVAIVPCRGTRGLFVSEVCEPLWGGG